MLLTLSQPAKTEFDIKPPHDYSPPLSNSVARPSPKANGGSFPPLQVSAGQTMSTPHRGLPPPAAMTLPDPSRGQPHLSSSFGSLPAPPSQWQGAEESMRSWLMAKAEEDKRRQEEEKTKQETIRLDQRRIEQSMLRDSLNGGIPQHLIPIIFAGIGGGNLASTGIEWLQHYLAQIQAQQHPAQQSIPGAESSPDIRRDNRLINPPAAYGPQQQQPQQPPLPGAPVLPGQSISQVGTSYAPGRSSPLNRARASSLAGAPTSAPRPPPHAALPRLTTNEMQVQPPPPASQAVHHVQSTAQTGQQEAAASSPSIYFHHWVPPTSQAEKSSEKQPSTPSEYTQSPKKRKAQGSHQPAPPPSTAPNQGQSPSFSHISSSAHSTPGRRGGGHARARSDTSTRGFDAQSRPLSRRGGGQHSQVADREPPSHQMPPEPRVERPSSRQQDTRQANSSRYSSVADPESEPQSPKREETSGRGVS
ncbi:MAG: hypothetical protein M1820_009352 [Bogoriella megaspora]|nr:MAG: hypothetical protein M1820_009352 [Bogoriella megaspora]